MCGINGIQDMTKEGHTLADKVNAMNNQTNNRGPDGKGVIAGEGFAIGHTRLAIVDPDNRNADQPMQNERYILTYNGEIYNHKELRKELEAKGIAFNTNCDTEVLLEGFSVFGKDILDKINGQFAFAIYDKKTGETFLARDRTAMKPLYFSTEKGFQFSSDPRAISENIGFDINLEGITSLLINGAAFAAGEEPLGSSTYREIQSLRPGEMITVSEGGNISRETYYSLPIRDIKNLKSESECISELRKNLESAIIKRIPDEVKIGCALSGGLDSSIITAVTADNNNKEVIAATIRYTSDSSNPDYKHAKILAQSRDNIKLISTDITPENFLDDLEEMVRALGPHDSIRQLAMFKNYKTLKDNGVKVVLTGEGADEFNWGYWNKFPGLKCDQEACSTEEGFKELISQRKSYVKQLFTDEAGSKIDFDKSIGSLLEIYESFDTTDSTRRMMGLYAVDFLGFLNKANDRCSMSHSLEARCPFQDVDVIETCVNIPKEYQIKNGTEKNALREAFREVLPEEIYRREKAPLPAAAHIDYHIAIADEFEKRIEDVDETFWNTFNKETFQDMAGNYRRRIDELSLTCNHPDRVGAALMAWRPISGTYNIIKGNDITTNDMFKLLTTMVWYDQNAKGGLNEQ